MSRTHQDTLELLIKDWKKTKRRFHSLQCLLKIQIRIIISHDKFEPTSQTNKAHQNVLEKYRTHESRTHFC